MSDSVRPHRRQPTRLRRPQDSPGKNTGVGCNFLLQCMKVKGEGEAAQSCLTLSDPMDCSLPGSSVHGIFQAEVLEWGAIAFKAHMSCAVSVRAACSLNNFLPYSLFPALFHYPQFISIHLDHLRLMPFSHTTPSASSSLLYIPTSLSFSFIY